MSQLKKKEFENMLTLDRCCGARGRACFVTKHPTNELVGHVFELVSRFVDPQSRFEELYSTKLTVYI
jgi:hypothetical protein